LDRPGKAFTIFAFFFIILIFLRFFYLYQLHGTVYFDHLILDSKEYDHAGRLIADGHLARRGEFTASVLYPYFLGSIYAVFGHNLLIPRILQTILGILSILLLFGISRKIFPPLPSFFTIIAASLYGMLLFYEGQILVTSLAIFLNLLLCYLLLVAAGRTSSVLWILCGLILGLSCLARPNNLLLYPFILAWLCFQFRAQKKALLRNAALITIIAVFVIAPVTWHNFQQTGEWILIASHGGMNFHIGNNPGATGTYMSLADVRDYPGLMFDDSGRIATIQSESPLGPAGISKFWYRQGMQFIKEHPMEWLFLIGKKVSLFWNHREARLNLDFAFHRKQTPLLYILWMSFGLVGPLSLVGLFLSLSSWRRFLILYTFFIPVLLSSVLFFVGDRYRLLAVPFLLPFAVLTVWRMIDSGKRSCMKRFSLIFLMVILAFAFSRLPLLGTSEFVVPYYNLGRIYHEIGLERMELACYQKAALINNTARAGRIVIGCAQHPARAGKMTFEIDRTIKGKPVSSIQVPLFSQTPPFTGGDSYLLFLKNAGAQKSELLGNAAWYQILESPESPPLVRFSIPARDMELPVQNREYMISLPLFIHFLEQILQTGDFSGSPDFFPTGLTKADVKKIRMSKRPGQKSSEKTVFWD